MLVKRMISIMSCAFLMLGLVGCEGKRVEIEPVDGWYATWAMAPCKADYDQIPKNPILDGNTCRQQLMTSIGGDKIRLTFSNEYGERALNIDSVHVAHLKYAGNPEIDVATDTVITFSGSESVTIPAGETMTSDEIDFSFEALDLLAVTVKYGSTPSDTTCHAEADCATWLVEGDHVSDENLSNISYLASWYFLSCVETYASAGAEVVVCFGDSITDGACSTWNGFDGWPENLSKIMQSDPATQNISVVNMGIGGNAVFGGWGDAAKDRFERDVLNMPGVHHVIILIGINDIPGAQTDISQDIINEYKAMIKACHEKGISVYGGTITPFGGNSTYYSELHEEIRTKINEFIMSSNSGFDGYIDFASAICYPEDATTMQSIYDCGDGLHPNSNGYSVMAKAAGDMLNDKWADKGK